MRAGEGVHQKKRGGGRPTAKKGRTLGKTTTQNGGWGEKKNSVLATDGVSCPSKGRYLKGKNATGKAKGCKDFKAYNQIRGGVQKSCGNHGERGGPTYASGEPLTVKRRGYRRKKTSRGKRRKGSIKKQKDSCGGPRGGRVSEKEPDNCTDSGRSLKVFSLNQGRRGKGLRGLKGKEKRGLC